MKSGSGALRRVITVTGILLVVAGLVVTGGVIVVGLQHTAQPSIIPPNAVTADAPVRPGRTATPFTLPQGQPVTDDNAIAQIRSDVGEFPVLNQITITHSTLGEMVPVIGDVPFGHSADEKIVMITGVGRFVPQFGHGLVLDWGSTIVDANTGVPIGTVGNMLPLPALLQPRRAPTAP